MHHFRIHIVFFSVYRPIRFFISFIVFHSAVHDLCQRSKLYKTRDDFETAGRKRRGKLAQRNFLPFAVVDFPRSGNADVAKKSHYLCISTAACKNTGLHIVRTTKICRLERARGCCAIIFRATHTLSYLDCVIPTMASNRGAKEWILNGKRAGCSQCCHLWHLC